MNDPERGLWVRLPSTARWVKVPETSEELGALRSELSPVEEEELEHRTPGKLQHLWKETRT